MLYYNLLTSSKLHSHLADVEEQAQDLFSRLVKEHAEKAGITENLKATDQMKWVQSINNIQWSINEYIEKEMVVSRVMRKFALVSGRNLLQGAA